MAWSVFGMIAGGAGIRVGDYGGGVIGTEVAGARKGWARGSLETQPSSSYLWQPPPMAGGRMSSFRRTYFRRRRRPTAPSPSNSIVAGSGTTVIVAIPKRPSSGGTPSETLLRMSSRSASTIMW